MNPQTQNSSPQGIQTFHLTFTKDGKQFVANVKAISREEAIQKLKAKLSLKPEPQFSGAKKPLRLFIQGTHCASCEVFIAGALSFFFILAGAWFLFSHEEGSPGEQTDALTPVDSVSHVHGLAVDIVDPTKLYIATHHGLFVLVADKDLFRMGKSTDDFMGFSVHPTDQNVFFASGHPASGGNLGVRKSEDQGKAWEKISTGVRGPVDFHAMAVSRANPKILYGWYQTTLQRSTDGGVTWEASEAKGLANVITLAADPIREEKVYAGIVKGLWASDDGGAFWFAASRTFENDAVIAIALHPKNNQEMLVFSQKLGLMRSNDGGTTWAKVNADFSGDLLLHIAWSAANPSVLYAATKESVLYKSIDGGASWQKIR